jgi:TRAP-type C4-dicarboxylate transport system permease small subunit
MNTVRKCVDKVLYVAIVILFIVMFGITTLNVILRYCFNSPLSFAVELSRYCFTAIVYLGSIFVMREDGHIGLDIIVDMLPGFFKIFIKKAMRVVVLCYLTFFCYNATRMVMENWANRSSTMRIPMSIVYLPMVIGSIGMFVEEVLLLIGYGQNNSQSAEEMGGGM